MIILNRVTSALLPVVAIVLLPILFLGLGAPRAHASAPAQTASGEPKRVTFIITQHVLLYEFKIVSWDQVNQILDKAALNEQIRPQFLFTNGGIARQEEVREHRWKLYKRLYDAGKTKGMTVGSVSPRTSERLDRIKTASDLLPDPAKKVFGRVLDVEGESLEDVEVFLLPEQHINSVYLRDGKIRNAYDEHMKLSAADGSFVIYPEEGEKLLAAVHPNGFVVTTLKDFQKTGHLRLKPWARVHGQRPTEGPDTKQKVYFTSYPVPGISFNIYETRFKPDGTFNQTQIPPGKIIISRAVETGDGGTRSFPVEQLELVPGATHKVSLGPVPDRAKAELKDR